MDTRGAATQTQPLISCGSSCGALGSWLHPASLRLAAHHCGIFVAAAAAAADSRSKFCQIQSALCESAAGGAKRAEEEVEEAVAARAPAPLQRGSRKVRAAAKQAGGGRSGSQKVLVHLCVRQFW